LWGIYTIRQILAKIVFYDIWNYCTTKKYDWSYLWKLCHAAQSVGLCK
jgi:hypothetical protein